MGWIQPRTILAIAWLFCLLTDNGSAIKCFNCHSSEDPKCSDPMDNSTIVLDDCSLKKGLFEDVLAVPTKCKKIKQEGGAVIRSCALASENNVTTTCSKGKDDKGVAVETCYCDDKDGCNSKATFNSAGISAVTTIGMVTSLLLSVMVFMMQ